MWTLLLLVGLGASASGCVRRRLTVRTSPPGAMVYVDHRRIGTTPVSTSYVYYGTRQFEIIKDGYRTEKFLRRFDPPWYELPVLDFISETLWPFEKRDERVVDVQLSQDLGVPTETLLQSGEQLRQQASRGMVVGAPPSATLDAATSVIPTTQPLGLAPSPASLNPGAPILVAPADPGVAANGWSTWGSIPAADVAPGASFRPETSASPSP